MVAFIGEDLWVGCWVKKIQVRIERSERREEGVGDREAPSTHRNGRREMKLQVCLVFRLLVVHLGQRVRIRFQG